MPEPPLITSGPPISTVVGCRGAVGVTERRAEAELLQLIHQLSHPHSYAHVASYVGIITYTYLSEPVLFTIGWGPPILSMLALLPAETELLALGGCEPAPLPEDLALGGCDPTLLPATDDRALGGCDPALLMEEVDERALEV